MRLDQIKIDNLRRIRHADIKLSPAAFLVGQNNYGKSSVLRAIELLLSAESPDDKDFWMDSEGNRPNNIKITGMFSGVDPATAQARGFRGRVVNGCYTYSKEYTLTSPKKARIECWEYPYSMKTEFASAKTWNDIVAGGVAEERLREVSNYDPAKKLPARWERELLDCVAEFDTSAAPVPVENPGGIPANVLSRLPQVIHVPPLTKEGDIGSADGSSIMGRALSILFEDLLAVSALAEGIKAQLTALEEEMSPSREGSLISVLATEVNKIIGSVFPGCGIEIVPALNELSTVLKPKYAISLVSNVKTDTNRQGTGLLRTAVFSMFRYHSALAAKRQGSPRPLLFAFEEPELYLHPAAANLLRETIYELGKTDQIICTTHSPWMVDLSKESQSITRMVPDSDSRVAAVNYGVSAELLNLMGEDRQRVKMLQVFDDELSRVFFADRVVVVEGDSECVALRETLKHLPAEQRRTVLARVQVVRARGKAAIISLVRYLQALDIRPFVIHDRDGGVAGAEVFNAPIAAVVGDPNRLAVLAECLENALGYGPPSKDKPFRAWSQAQGWSRWDEIPSAWRDVVLAACDTPAPVVPSATNALDGAPAAT